MIRRYGMILSAVAVGLVAGQLVVPRAQPGIVRVANAVSRSAGTSAIPTRVATWFREPWQSFCSGDACGVALFSAVTITTPMGVDSVDVTVTLTFDYSISRGDTGVVYAQYQATSGGRLTTLQPGVFRLGSDGPGSQTTTATWVKNALPAQGREYQIRFGAPVEDSSGDRKATLGGSKSTVVVEMYPTAA